jgi:hypothetical protein
MGGAALLGLLLQGGPPFLVAAMTVIKLLEYGTTVVGAGDRAQLVHVE